MRRVRYNVKLLVRRLKAADYPFANSLFPAGDDADARFCAVFAPPLPGTRATLDQVEQMVGALPISVRAWYEEIGAVNFQSRGYDALGEYDNPLMVVPVEYTLAEARQWRASAANEREECPFRWEFAPDVLHKANVSGGAAFGIQLPSGGADGIVEEEVWGQMPFVSYLRDVFRWGGFPGLRRLPPERQQRRLVARLHLGLLPF